MRADILIIDGRNLLWRTSDAFKNLAAEVGDEVIGTGGMYGFLCSLIRVHQKYGGVVKIAWEGITNFRKEIYPLYKKRGDLSPETLALIQDMGEQERRLKAILRSMGVEQYYGYNCEADDVMGRISLEGKKADKLVMIYSGDSDMRQLVDNNVYVISPGFNGGKDTIYDIDKVNQRYGIMPELISDLKALSGDTSDNIPGVKGIGDVTATKLIAKYGDVEKVFNGAKNDNKEWPISERFRNLLLNNAEYVRLFKQLTVIRRDMPMGVISIAKDKDKLLKYFRLYQFSSLSSNTEMHLLTNMDK